MRTYGQYCPIARGAEIFAERWTPLIIRNLYLGCGNFNEILAGAPGLSRTLLSQRLKQLEGVGIVESAPKADGRGQHYKLTSAGQELFAVCQSLGEWGARWLEIAPENLDPFVALWSMCRALRRDRPRKRRVRQRGIRPHPDGTPVDQNHCGPSLLGSQRRHHPGESGSHHDYIGTHRSHPNMNAAVSPAFEDHPRFCRQQLLQILEEPISRAEGYSRR